MIPHHTLTAFVPWTIRCEESIVLIAMRIVFSHEIPFFGGERRLRPPFSLI